MPHIRCLIHPALAGQEFSGNCDWAYINVRSPVMISPAQGVSIHIKGKDEKVRAGDGRRWLAAASCQQAPFTFKPVADGPLGVTSLTKQVTSSGSVAIMKLINFPEGLSKESVTVRFGENSVSPTMLKSTVVWDSASSGRLTAETSVPVPEFSCLQAECIVNASVSFMRLGIFTEAAFTYTYIGVASPVIQSLTPQRGSTTGGTQVFLHPAACFLCACFPVCILCACLSAYFQHTCPHVAWLFAAWVPPLCL